ncbi:PREDICTED: flexible cuticle protein 12-like [Habropoda laboriosa]|uniref:flexible cuticle protein 12-like n=1 Tax=Habropoda laboriosa TaxID=597456 RepID=UPI00083DA3AE|nr:PREDICTED: flexible cuticle protein 12-like [Habropoda laboriosa]
MKTIIAFAALVAVALAAPPPLVLEHVPAVLVKEVPSDNIGLGGYNYGYELSDGQAKHETAELVEGGAEGAFLRVRGSFSFVDPLTNVPYTVNYVADENGFQPQGEHIPHN